MSCHNSSPIVSARLLAGQVPMYSPRGAAIDSASEVWVVYGSSANLTELIGVAAPRGPASPWQVRPSAVKP